MEDKKISDLARVASTGGPELTEVVKGSGNFSRKNNMTASAAPGVGNDSSDGYSVGSMWFYDGVLYILNDDTIGAAVWTRFGALPQGAFTPTVSNESGVSAVNIDSAAYQDFGTYVHYQVKVGADFDTPGVGGGFDINVPVASPFTNPRQLWCAFNGSGSDNVKAVTVDSFDADTITISIQPTASALAFQGLDILIVYIKA